MFKWHNFFETRHKCVVDNIEKCIKKGNSDIFLSTVSISDPAKLFALLREHGYYISGIFELGNIYTDIVTELFLLWVSKDKPEDIFFSIYDGVTYNLNDIVVVTDKFALPERFNDRYESYKHDIEYVINKGRLPDNYSVDGDVFKIRYTELDLSRLYPRYYTKQAYKVRESLKDQAVFKLKELATIIIPELIPTEQTFPLTKMYKSLCLDSLKYPFDPITLLDTGGKTTCVQKRDILFPTRGMNPLPYYFDYEANEDICCGYSIVIIRCTQISPEYLYVYLMSDTGKSIIDSFVPGGERFKAITPKDIEDIPIIIPEYDDEYYENACKLLISSDARDYKIMSVCAGMNLFWSLKSKEGSKLKTEDILGIEIAKRIRIHNEEQLKNLLFEDLEELNICFRNKAYKASLILAGSILEAVLIDWLSEIHGKDYFEEDYYIVKNGRRQRADLIDYINEIKYIKRPDWMETADKAHKIRQKRNLVHARLCLRSDEINEAVCREVISYLSDVLKTRGVNVPT